MLCCHWLILRRRRLLWQPLPAAALLADAASAQPLLVAAAAALPEPGLKPPTRRYLALFFPCLCAPTPACTFLSMLTQSRREGGARTTEHWDAGGGACCDAQALGSRTLKARQNLRTQLPGRRRRAGTAWMAFRTQKALGREAVG